MIFFRCVAIIKIRYTHAPSLVPHFLVSSPAGKQTFFAIGQIAKKFSACRSIGHR